MIASLVAVVVGVGRAAADETEDGIAEAPGIARAIPVAARGRQPRSNVYGKHSLVSGIA